MRPIILEAHAAVAVAIMCLVSGASGNAQLRGGGGGGGAESATSLSASMSGSSPFEVQFESLAAFQRPAFTHPRSTYDGHDAALLRAFAGFHGLLDHVWEGVLPSATPEEPQSAGASTWLWEKERRFVSHHMVKMRDGVRLSTIVIRPTLRSSADLGNLGNLGETLEPGAEERRGTLLSRSPYGPTSDQIATLFMATNGLVAVIQDQRGTFLSEGRFTMWQQDGDDGYDTMEWIAAQPWSDGEVFSAGVSADGCAAFTQILDEPQWLKGQFIMLASANAHETLFPGGAFREGLVEGWMTAMSLFTKGHSLTSTLPAILAHEALSSWYDTVEADEYYANVQWPTVHLTAWWDIFAGHHIRAWHGLSEQSAEAVRDKHTIFIGPYGHCELHNAGRPEVSLHEATGWLNAFGFATELFAGNSQGRFHRAAKRVNFFVQGPYHPDGNTPQVGNFWTSHDDFPETSPTKMFLSKGRRAVLDAEGLGAAAVVDAGDDEYTYAPHRPVRTVGGNNLVLAMLGDGCGPQDQSAAEARDDVLVFTTDAPLDAPLALVGRLTAVLFVSSNRKDTDFTVAVTDVYPEGPPEDDHGKTKAKAKAKSLLVRYGIRRMRWRDSARQESGPMERGKVYRIEVDLWPTAHVFNVGHRLRVTVSSSNSPYYLRNSNIDHDAEHDVPEIFGEPAKNAVHFSAEHPSHVLLPVVGLDQLKPNLAL